jgi:MazG family protein
VSDLGEALLELQRLTERLRHDCPWDRQQTTKTIVPYTLEEAYEVADAALAGDAAKLLDELGDLLFQVYFLALLLAEEGKGDLAEVARSCHAKLVRRHPHIFAEAEAWSPGEVRQRWEQIKVGEEGREGIFHHVDEGLPALLYARKLQRRAAAVGFDYPDVVQALADLAQELSELDAATAAAPAPAPESEPDPELQDELGDVLFAAVNVARRANVDPELALRRAAQRFRERVERASELAQADGQRFAELALHEQDSYFDRAKERER